MAQAGSFQLFTSLRFDRTLLALKDLHPHDLGWNTEKASPLYMLDYHRWRMLEAAKHWGWTKAIEVIQGSEGLARLESFVLNNLAPDELEDPKPLRIKILLSQQGELRLESSVVPTTTLANLFPDQLHIPDGTEESRYPTEMHKGTPNVSPPYDVYLDRDITHRSEFTHYKTTKREMYDKARLRAGLSPTDATKEVLIVNHTSGLVMEGSLTTPYFWRGGRWVTPPVSCDFSDEHGSGGQNGTTRRWALERNIAFEEQVQASDVADGEGVWLSNGVRGFIFGRIRRFES